jgi:hypothetical protein
MHKLQAAAIKYAFYAKIEQCGLIDFKNQLSLFYCFCKHTFLGLAFIEFCGSCWAKALNPAYKAGLASFFILRNQPFVFGKKMIVMKQIKKATSKPVDRQKIRIIYILFILSGAIAASGAFFSVYSLVNQITFKVINTNVSGAIFGLIVTYLGVRYFLSVFKLREAVYAPTAKFSWSNFRKSKTAKSR